MISICKQPSLLDLYYSFIKKRTKISIKKLRGKKGERWKKDECWDSSLKEREEKMRRWRGGEGGGRSRGRDYRGWVRVTRRRRRQRSLDGAPSMLINPFAHAVYCVHALIKREPAITIIPRICSDFLERETSIEREWMDGWTLPIKRSGEKEKRRKERRRKKKKRSARFDSSFEEILWLEEIFKGEGEEKASGAYKIVCLARDISRVNQSATSVKNVFPACLRTLSLSLSLFLCFSLASRWKIRIPGEGGGKKWNATSWISLLKNRSGRGTFSRRYFRFASVERRASPPLMKKATLLLASLWKKKKEKKRKNSLIILAVRSLCES